MNYFIVLALYLAGFGCAHSASLGIVDGDEVTKNSIPYQAHIELRTDFSTNWNCTGILISENYVLTTTKCVWSGATSAMVLLGAHNIDEEEESSRQSLPAKRGWKIYNTNFTYDTLENNIALIQLPTPAELNEYVQVAKLASSDVIKVGQTGKISGWGVNKGDLETVLHGASTTVVENSVCASAYENLYADENILCTQADDGASGCNGDGGAPLVIDDVVVGIYSGGPIYAVEGLTSNCTDKPNIFTKISSYLDWIKENSDYE